MSTKTTTFSRRDFAKLSATALAAIPLMSFQNPMNNLFFDEKKPQINLFSKHLQFLDYTNMAEAAAEMGFDGLDLTVRRKGHVLPEEVSENLPKAVNAMKKVGFKPTMMSTNVWDVDKPVNVTVLETASNLGFTHYRTDWLKYSDDKTIIESQKEFAQQAKKLAVLNKKLGIVGGYQNHSGKHVGAPVWDLPPILENVNTNFLGAQYDIRHAIAEGGGSWELGLKNIKPYINSIVIKDFKWGVVKGKWKPIHVPLGEGMVDFKRYFTLLKQYKINVPISLHVEYKGLGGAEKGRKTITIPQKEVFSQIKKDLNFLKEALKNVE